MSCAWKLTGLIVLGAVVLQIYAGTPTESSNAKADSSKQKISAQPVEPSMHEFMEYVFEPPYKRLRVAMTSAPDNAGWKAIKSDSLILAEAGNLLLPRHPEENEALWREHSVAVRDLGKHFYTAARKKDYDAAKKGYTVLLRKCNSCHDKFAGGEHQLKP